MKNILYSFLLIYSSMGSYAQDLSEEEGRQVEDMSAKLEKLKKNLMSMQKESGTESKEIQNKIVPRTTRQNQPTTSPPYLPLSRSRKSSVSPRYIPTTRPSPNIQKKSRLSEILGTSSPKSLKDSSPANEIDQSIQNLDLKMSTLRDDLFEITGNKNADNKIVDEINESKDIPDFPDKGLITNKNSKNTNPEIELNESSLTIPRTAAQDLRSEIENNSSMSMKFPKKVLGKTMTGKIESNFKPSDSKNAYFEYQNRFTSSNRYKADALSSTNKEVVANPQESLGNNNSFNFYYGFTIPNTSEYDGFPISYQKGQQITIEFLHDFGIMSVGGGYFYTNFENDHFSPSNIVIPISGENSHHGFYVSSAIEPKVTKSIFLRGKFSGGFAFTTSEIIAQGFSAKKTGSSFKYSLLAGIGVRWSDHFHSILYYEFDGITASGEFNGLTTHQYGVGLGFDF
jgi:hypothetical protein